MALLADGERYVGQAFIALPAVLRDEFWRFVKGHASARPAVQNLGRKKGATWTDAGLAATVKHLRGEPEMLRNATVTQISIVRKEKAPSRLSDGGRLRRHVAPPLKSGRSQ